MKAVLLSLVLSLVLAPAAEAITCRTWNRLDSYAKSQQVDLLIQEAMRGSEGRQYTSVQRGGVERCLRDHALSIQYDFDDACAEGSSAGMGALRGIFKNYVWSCVR